MRVSLGKACGDLQDLAEIYRIRKGSGRDPAAHYFPQIFFCGVKLKGFLVCEALAWLKFLVQLWRIGPSLNRRHARA